MPKLVGTSDVASVPAVTATNTATDGSAGEFNGSVKVNGLVVAGILNATQIYCYQNNSSVTSFGVEGQSVYGYGVQGINGSDGSGFSPIYGCGVWGDSAEGYGVYASSKIHNGLFGTSSGDDGVHGETTSTAHSGVSGLNDNVGCAGVYGTSSAGHGVRGINSTASGDKPIYGCGVWGDSAEGYGVYASSKIHNGLFGTSSGDDGVHGETTSTAHSGVSGLNDNVGCAGVYGTSSAGHGVRGINSTASGDKPIYGCGVWGDSAEGYGVYASSKIHNGLFGTSSGDDGVHGETTSTAHSGVSGLNDNVGCAGVYGTSNAGHGVHGINGPGGAKLPTVGCGVWGESVQGYGIYGVSQSGVAGMFAGNVTVTGDHTVQGNIWLPGAADCAEQFDTVEGERLDPGTVVVIDAEGALRKSTDAYDKKVAGVVSGAGDYKPGIIFDGQGSQSGRTAVALMGKVYCRVDADYSSIEVGDLLTTSPTPGYAMRAQDPGQSFGAVLGKALRALNCGQDLIPVLVALQ